MCVLKGRFRLLYTRTLLVGALADFSFVMRVNLILDLKKKKKEFDLIWWLENKNQSNILISKLESRKENFAKLEQYIGNSKE